MRRTILTVLATILVPLLLLLALFAVALVVPRMTGSLRVLR